MTETEKIVVAALSDLSRLVSEIADMQAKLAGVVAKVPGLSETERRNLLAALEPTQRQLRAFRSRSEALKSLTGPTEAL